MFYSQERKVDWRDMLDDITLARPSDLHLHLRDDKMMEAVLPYTTKHFSRAIVMPNLAQPITTNSLASKYRDKILLTKDRLAKNKNLKEKFNLDRDFKFLMTCYLTDDSDSHDLEQGFSDGVIKAVKMYPARATTNSQYGLTDFYKPDSVYRMMTECSMPLLIHGELSSPDIDIYDREKAFIDTVLCRLITDYPDLKIVLEHITTKDAVDFIVNSKHKNLAATITPHHLWINRSDMFAGGKVNPHLFCLPIAKRELHRQALIEAATSGDKRFFAGTDSAPHARGDKESACGCAGVFNTPTALSTYTEIFEREKKLTKEGLENFLNNFGSNFYGGLVGEQDDNDTLTLKRKTNRVEESIKTADEQEIMVFRGGEEIAWKCTP